MPLNRLYSLEEWLERDQPDGTVVLLDCDFIFRSPITRPARPGAPAAQEWFGFLLGGAARAAVEAISPGTADRAQPVTWPTRMHTSDLGRLLPRWFELTSEIRERLGAWESDMFAFAAASAELGITFSLEPIGAWMNWPEDVVAGAPIIHYCQPVENGVGSPLWFKRDYTPWEPLGFDPGEARLDYCRELMGLLAEYAAIRSGGDR